MRKIKVFVISDLHLKNNSRHDEYLLYFEFIKDILLTHKPDYVIFCGDLFHSKTTLSPDSFTYAYQFLKMLSICPNTQVVVLAGNHDMNEKNLDKLDAISPVFEHLDPDRYYYCKTANDIFYDDIAFRPFPLTDKENWKFSRNHISDSEILVGIYHGPLNGVKTDLGYIFTDGRDVSEFKACDYLFCGDIHSRTDYNVAGSKISVGNPIQQDFGENLVKGIWIYEIESRTDFIRKFIEIPNFFPYVTLTIPETLPELAQAKSVRFRVFSDKSYEETLEYIKNLKHVFSGKIHSLTISRLPADTVERTASKIITYEEYIEQHVHKDKLLELYNKYIKEIEYISNITNWKIKKITWDNLFGYAEENSIDFTKEAGRAIGIFGKNYSGKTSIIDVICYGLFGSWTKDFVPLINFINDKKPMAQVFIELQINNKEYSISRKIERTGKTCKSSIIFRNETDNIKLNDLDGKATQRVIEEYIGTKSQFLLTSLSTQFNNFSLLTEKNTKRKEYFSSFLGITKYEQIYKIVKDDIKTLKQNLDNGKTGNFIEYANEVVELGKSLKILNETLEQIETSIIELSKVDKRRLDSIKENKEKKHNIEYKISESKKKILSLSRKKEIMNKEIIKELPPPPVQSMNISELRDLSKKLLDRKSQMLEESRAISTKLAQFRHSRSLLDSVPCGTQYLHCRFISNSKAGLDFNEEVLEESNSILTQQILQITEEISVLEQKLSDQINNLTRQREYDKLIQKQELWTKSMDILLAEEIVAVNEVDELLREYIEIENLVNKDYEVQKELEEITSRELELFKRKISTEGDIKITEYRKKNIEDHLSKLEKEHLKLKYLEDFADSVGKNGIIISILNEYVPAITDFVNNILSNFVEFSINIEIENDKDVEIYITDSFSTRLVETCSGSQLTIISYALRMALLHYCQIPSCDLLIMDEPATSLDSDHLAEFSKLLDMIKLNKKTILVVTHIMILKDFMDISLVIDKSSGYSKIIT